MGAKHLVQRMKSHTVSVNLIVSAGETIVTETPGQDPVGERGDVPLWNSVTDIITSS